MAQGATRYTIRPLPSRLARNDKTDAFRILLSPAALVGLKLSPGDMCNIHLDDGPLRTAIAWNALEKIQDSIVQASTTLQDLYKLRLGDKVSITKLEGPMPEIERVSVKEIEPVEQGGSSPPKVLSDADQPHWEWFLQYPLRKSVFLSSGMMFKNIELKGQERSFVLADIKPKPSIVNSSLFWFTPSSQVCLIDSEHKREGAAPDVRSFQVEASGIGGLDDQINTLNGTIDELVNDIDGIQLPSFYRPEHGVLLYGAKGTGKSLLIKRVLKCPWRRVFIISSEIQRSPDASNKIQRTFSEAVQSQPSLVIVNHIETLAGKGKPSDESVDSAFVSALRAGFDTIQDAKVLVLAEVRHPNAIDESLRGAEGFDVEIEIPVPTARQRYDILRALCGASEEPSKEILHEFSGRTHGYVGKDLYQLLRRAVRLAKDQYRFSQKQRNGVVNGTVAEFLDEKGGELGISLTAPLPPNALHITADNMGQALRSIRPSAMQEIFLETPHIHWSDIGGQHKSKRLLQLAVSRPLQQAPAMRRLGSKSKKGVLLYGPPGCSKTLLVKALAAESGLNFLAVKGPEIVSKYVGESERNIREIFRRARDASPSIIFFDEIDSIAGDKTGSSGVGGSLNLLTTFLNELDGFEELKDVLVVAATNRPETLDPALLRPGRFDNLIYIGLPSREARHEILQIFFQNSKVAENVNAATLADLTEGYSGAEIAGICQTASDLTLDAAAEQDTPLDSIFISLNEFLEAIRMTSKGISPELEKAYIDWRGALQ